MSTSEQQLLAWMEELRNYRLPRWAELPDIDLYMDQIITLVERYLSPLISEEKILTSSMINNYVKLGILPKPSKKRYQRVHLARLIVITILKQVLLIPEIKDGIFLQTRLDGLTEAYDHFCQELEDVLRAMIDTYLSPASASETPPLTPDRIGLHMACVSAVGKTISRKVIQLRMAEANDDRSAQAGRGKEAQDKAAQKADDTTAN